MLTYDVLYRVSWCLMVTYDISWCLMASVGRDLIGLNVLFHKNGAWVSADAKELLTHKIQGLQGQLGGGK